MVEVQSCQQVVLGALPNGACAELTHGSSRENAGTCYRRGARMRLAWPGDVCPALLGAQPREAVAKAENQHAKNTLAPTPAHQLSDQ